MDSPQNKNRASCLLLYPTKELLKDNNTLREEGENASLNPYYELYQIVTNWERRKTSKRSYQNRMVSDVSRLEDIHRR